MTSLDRKLASILGGTYTPADFVIADAKDADMAFGAAAAGPVPGAGPAENGETAFRTRPQYLQHMRDLVGQGVLDILLTSASNGEALAGEGLFGGSEVTLAVRANDTTDIWFPRGASYSHHPSRPFRTADLEQVRPFCDLVLYSVTFNNDVERDLATVEAYARFRKEAAAVGIRHFLEVFNPNSPRDLEHHEVGHFVNDWIIRLLAGVTTAHRPLFLKMAFNGSAALERAGRARPVAGGRAARRLGRHHPGHLRAAAPRRAGRGPGLAVRPQDPAGRVAARPGRPAAAGAAGQAHPARRGSAPTTTSCGTRGSPRPARWRTTCGSPSPRCGTDDRPGNDLMRRGRRGADRWR